MAVLFAFHEWSPLFETRFLYFLSDLFRETRTTGVHIEFFVPGKRLRKIRRFNAVLEGGVKGDFFSLSAFSDPDPSTKESLASPWVSGKIRNLADRRLFSFFCHYLSVDELLDLVMRSGVLNHLTNGYGYICDAKDILVPDYYVSGIDALQEEDLDRSISSFLAGTTPIGKWAKALSAKQFLSGHFRDIYPVNVLNSSHVAALRALDIFSKPNDLRLENLGSDMHLLMVPEGSREWVTAVVSKAGLLLAQGNEAPR
jgi:hypothetical protein